LSSIKLFYRFLFSGRAESLIRALARLGVAATFVSVFSLVVVLSVMNGFAGNIQGKLLAVEPHIAVEGAESQRVEEVFADQPDQLDEVLTYQEQDLILRTIDGYFSGAVARGLSQDHLEKFLVRALKVQPEALMVDQLELGKNEIFMGFDLAKSLNVFQGDQVILIPPESLLLPSGEIPNLERGKVKGLLQTNVSSFDSKMVIYRNDVGLSRLSKTETIRSISEVRLKDPSQYLYWQNQLIERLQIPRQKVQSWASKNSTLLFALKLERWAMSTLLGLSVLVTSFSIIMVLLILISEKQKDIGLLMALGLSRARTRNLFGRVGLYLGLAGCILGLILGVFVSLFLQKNPLQFMPTVYVDSTLPSKVDFKEIFWISICLLSLTFIASFGPATQAIRRLPAEGLRGLNALRKIR